MNCSRCARTIKSGKVCLTFWNRIDDAHIIYQLCPDCAEQYLKFMRGNRLCSGACSK